MRPPGLAEPFPEIGNGALAERPVFVAAGPEALAVSAFVATTRAPAAAATATATATALLAGLAATLAAAAALLARFAALAAGLTALLFILCHLFLRISVNPAFS